MTSSSESYFVSAPGKVILFGEHAVVHGKMALAGSLNLRTMMKLEKLSTSFNEIQLFFTDLDDKCIIIPINDDMINLFKQIKGNPQSPQAPTDETLQKIFPVAGVSESDKCRSTRRLAIVSFIYLYAGILGKCKQPPPMKLTVKSRLWIGAGLGSSAAYSTCLACALLLHSGAIDSKSVPTDYSGSSPFTVEELRLINSWSLQSEIVLHKKPSGIDNSTSTYGGSLSFHSGHIQKLARLPELKILLINTEVQRSTKKLVQNVTEKCEKYKSVMDPILEAVDSISHQSKNLLQNSTLRTEILYEQIQDLVEMNQHLLEAMGVSHPSIEIICRTSRRFNLKTKLTGAGGGGCTFTIIPPDYPAEKLKSFTNTLTALGYKFYQTYIGGPGVLQHRHEEWLLAAKKS